MVVLPAEKEEGGQRGTRGQYAGVLSDRWRAVWLPVDEEPGLRSRVWATIGVDGASGRS